MERGDIILMSRNSLSMLETDLCLECGDRKATFGSEPRSTQLRIGERGAGAQ